MPVAVPLIASVAAASLIPAGFTIGALSAAATASLISGAAGLLASAAMGAISGGRSPDLSAALSQGGAGRTQQIRQPTSPLSIPYGRVKTSGPILFAHTASVAGGINSNLYLIHAFAGTQIKGIDDIYLGDDLSSRPQYGVESGITITRFSKHLGSSSQTADSNFVSEIGSVWGPNHRLRGIAYLASRLYFSVNAFGGTGIPNISAIINGVNTIYDPRTDTTGFSENAALIVADFLTAPYGMNLAWSKLDEPSVIAAANVCDERVLVRQDFDTFTADSATNALTHTGLRVLDWGDGVRVSSSTTLPAGLSAATTYYVIPYVDGTIRLATSVANAFTETEINITSTGSGTHTLTYYDEARYKCNGSFTLDAQQNDILQQLLTSMAGVTTHVGGKWFVHAGSASTPTITLTADDLSGDLAVSPKRSKRDRFNGVRAVFVNPSKNWQPTDAKPRLDAGYLAEDGGEERYDDVRFNFTTSEPCAQRLMNVHLQRNRRQRTVQAPFKLTAMRLMPWDGVYLDIERGNGSHLLEDSQHRVIGWRIDEECRVHLDLQEDDSAIWDWTTAEEHVVNPQGELNLLDPLLLAAPASIIVDTPILPTYSRLNATIAEVSASWFDGFEVEFKPAAFVTWSGTGGRIQTNLISIVTSEAIDIQARAAEKNGPLSDFTQNNAPDRPTDFVVDGVDPLKITWTNGSGTAEVQIFQGLSDVASSTLYDTVTGIDETTVPDDYFYWLRSVNSTGNVSGMTASVTVGTPGSGSGAGGGNGTSGGDGRGDPGPGDE